MEATKERVLAQSHIRRKKTESPISAAASTAPKGLSATGRIRNSDPRTEKKNHLHFRQANEVWSVKKREAGKPASLDEKFRHLMPWASPND
jgi:hypothetical protein